MKKSGEKSLRFELMQIDSERLRSSLHIPDAEESLSAFSQISITELHRISREMLSRIPREITQGGDTTDALGRFKALAEQLFTLLLGDHRNVLNKLSARQKCIVIMDAELSFIPVELLHSGEFYLCERFIIGRQIASISPRQKPSISKNWNEITLIGNPSEDKDIDADVRKELLELSDFLEDYRGPFFGRSSTKSRLSHLLENSRYFHYSGHFRSAPDHEGWELFGPQYFQAEDIDKLRSVPEFIFSNSCGDVKKLEKGNFIRQFLEKGTRAYLTSLGELPNQDAKLASRILYSKLAAGQTLSEALFHLRIKMQQNAQCMPLSWALFAFYGNPDFRFQVKRQSLPVKKRNLKWVVHASMVLLIISIATFWQFRPEGQVIFINTNPVAAQISVNDRMVGTSPASVSLFKKDKVLLHKEGFNSEKLRIVQDVDLKIGHNPKFDGVFRRGNFHSLQSQVSDSINIFLLGKQDAVLRFQNLPQKGRLFIMPDGAIFSSDTLAFSVDRHPIQLIYEADGLVFDCELRLLSDSLITYESIQKHWYQGRFRLPEPRQ